MKRLQVLLLVALSSTLLLFGCGKEEEPDTPAVSQVIEKQAEPEADQSGEQVLATPEDETSAPGYYEAPPK